MPAGEPAVSSLVELPTALGGQLFSFATTAEEQDGCRELTESERAQLQPRGRLRKGLAPSISVFLVRKEDGKRLELTQGAVVSNTRQVWARPDPRFVWELRQDTATAMPKLHARFEATTHFMVGPPVAIGLPVSSGDDLEMFELVESNRGTDPSSELFLSALTIRLVPTTHEVSEDDDDEYFDGYDGYGCYDRTPPACTTELSTLLSMLQAPSFASRWV